MILGADIPYKVIWEKISCDEYSNIVVIHRRYELPRPRLFKTPSRFLDCFYAYDGLVEMEQGAKIEAHCGGWADAQCRSYDMIFVIIPNGGNVIYTEGET